MSYSPINDICSHTYDKSLMQKPDIIAYFDWAIMSGRFCPWAILSGNLSDTSGALCHIRDTVSGWLSR